MNTLSNIKKAPLEVATLLANDKFLCKLLFNDGPDALDRDLPGNVDLNFLLQNHYICFFPPVENRIEEYGRNTFLSILLDAAMDIQDANTRGTLVIYVSTNESQLLLKDNKQRLLEACDRINVLLNNQKITSAGQLRVTSMSHVLLSEFHTSYRLNVSLTDQNTVKGEM